MLDGQPQLLSGFSLSLPVSEHESARNGAGSGAHHVAHSYIGPRDHVMDGGQGIQLRRDEAPLNAARQCTWQSRVDCVPFDNVIT